MDNGESICNAFETVFGLPHFGLSSKSTVLAVSGTSTNFNLIACNNKCLQM